MTRILFTEDVQIQHRESLYGFGYDRPARLFREGDIAHARNFQWIEKNADATIYTAVMQLILNSTSNNLFDVYDLSLTSDQFVVCGGCSEVPLSPKQAMVLVNLANAGTTAPEFTIQAFINRRHKLQEVASRVDNFRILFGNRNSEFFDISYSRTSSVRFRAATGLK